MTYSRFITQTAKMARSGVHRPLTQLSINIPGTVRTQTNFAGRAFPVVTQPVSPTTGLYAGFQNLQLSPRQSSSPFQQAARNFGSFAAGTWFVSYADKYGLDDLGLSDLRFNVSSMPSMPATPKYGVFDANNWENSLLFSGNFPGESNANCDMDSVNNDAELEVVPVSKYKNLDPPPIV